MSSRIDLEVEWKGGKVISDGERIWFVKFGQEPILIGYTLNGSRIQSLRKPKE